MLAESADTKLAASGEKRFVGADENGLSILGFGWQRLLRKVGHGRNAVFTAFGDHLADKLVRGVK
jgi:hypothetical protein